MSHSDDEALPVHSVAGQTGDHGMRMVDRAVSEQLGWVFRDQTRNDFGVDAHIEVKRSDQRMTGRLVAAQIKCGGSWFREESEDGSGWVFRGERRHLNYWTRHSLPVIVVLCDPDAGTCHFAHVRRGAVRETGDGWAMTVPREQVLDASAREALERLARGPQRVDLFRAMILGQLVEQFGGRLRVLPEYEIPRDYHRYEHLVAVQGDGMCCVQCIDADAQPLTAELLGEEARWLDYNRRTAGADRLLLYLVGDSVDAVQVPSDVLDLLETLPDVRLHRLLFTEDWGPGLSEVDADGSFVPHYPDET